MVNVTFNASKAIDRVRGHREQEIYLNVRPRVPRAKLARTNTDLELD
jgi:hypothetical protein